MSSQEDSKQIVSDFFRAVGNAGYDHSIIKTTEVVSANKDETVFALTVTIDLCNSLGSMHGGAMATAIDLFTVRSSSLSIDDTDKTIKSAAIVPNSRDGFWELAGVSRTLSVTYLRPAPLDGRIFFHCKVVALSKRTAALSCEVVDGTGKKLAVGFHDKVNIDRPKL